MKNILFIPNERYTPFLQEGGNIRSFRPSGWVGNFRVHPKIKKISIIGEDGPDRLIESGYDWHPSTERWVPVYDAQTDLANNTYKTTMSDYQNGVEYRADWKHQSQAKPGDIDSMVTRWNTYGPLGGGRKFYVNDPFWADIDLRYKGKISDSVYDGMPTELVEDITPVKIPEKRPSTGVYQSVGIPFLSNVYKK